MSVNRLGELIAEIETLLTTEQRHVDNNTGLIVRFGDFGPLMQIESMKLDPVKLNPKIIVQVKFDDSDRDSKEDAASASSEL